MPAVIERVIAKDDGAPPATEWLESVPRRTWTRSRSRAHEFASHGEADVIAGRLREERDHGDTPFFIFAKISKRHPEPELPMEGELTFEGRSEREQAQIREAVAAESPTSEDAELERDWHRHAVNCGWD